MYADSEGNRFETHIFKLICLHLLRKTANQEKVIDHKYWKIPCNSIPATLFAAATIPGSVFGGVIADKWGKKLTMCTANLLAYGFWLTTAFARNKYLLFLSYSLQGLFGVVAFNLVGKHIFINIEEKVFTTGNLCRDLHC